MKPKASNTSAARSRREGSSPASDSRLDSGRTRISRSNADARLAGRVAELRSAAAQHVEDQISNAQAAHPAASDEPTDRDLVERVLGGEREAFDVLIHRYQRQAVAVSYRLLGNSHDALEVTQDAFLKAFSSLSTLQKPEAFGGWLMRIVSNLSLNFRRSRKTRSQLPLDDLLGPMEPAQSDTIGGGSDWMAQSGDPLHTLASREMGKRLSEALSQLPEKQRLAIVMFTIEQMPQKQVADTLGCSVEAVKWHVFQGRKKLREMLKEHL